MSRIVGIDLGTTNSLVAAVDAGIPYVIAGRDGQRLTPSVVNFPKQGEPIVGGAAQRLRAVEPARTIYSVKRFIGRRANEIASEELTVSYPITNSGAGPARIEIADHQITPEEVSAEVLKKLRADAEAALGEEITRAVITVPAYFNDAQRNATKRAGELAGLTVERIINEPTAAALAYGLDKLKEHARIAVYDLGGGTFDLSVLELNEGIFQVLSTNGNTRLGGDDLDARIVEFLRDKIRAADGPDISEDPILTARVREAAEAAKIHLSTETATDIALPFLTPAFSFQYNFTREELERLTIDIIQRTRAHCIRSLSDAKLQAKDLDQVVLVGGQTRMPLVRRLVKEWFGCVDFESVTGSLRIGADYHRPEGPALNTGQNPDEAVALGAAIQGEILSGGFKNMLLLDITPLSLGLETFGGLMNVIIPRNSTIPIKAGEVFTTAVDNQSSMSIHVLQGERERAKDNWSLGKFTIDFEKASRGVPRVGVQFEIDANGILHVLARDIRTGREKIVEMKSAVDVNDADVQRMVEESVEHAFEDLEARRWIEAKLRANETIAATRKGLSDFGGELPESERAAIEETLRALEQLTAAETGNSQTLKAAHATLDEATKPLAQLMMDKAMEAMLRKRGLL
ncbi:MAG TPA: Hsp70 family protein [Verrucomicrobiae bacterium]